MARAVDSLSTSAPPKHQDGLASSGDYGSLIFSPGGYSYGGSTGSGGATKKKNKALKQAKGTGRICGKAPNERSYSQLVDLAEQTPGAEIRIVQTNEGLIRKEDKIRLKYYESCRKMVIAENQRRASIIQEEEGESTPLLQNNPSINHTDGFLVSFLRLIKVIIFISHN